MNMASQSLTSTRRTFIAGLTASGAALILPASVQAQGLGSVLGLDGVLGDASDRALDKLALPGAFYNDEDIRIGLPMIGGARRGGGLFGSIFGAARDLGVLDGLIRSLNDAAGIASGEAKPIFREAIGNLSLSDAPGIIREDTGGTQYLRRSSNDHLHSRLSPLVDSALSDLGAYNELERVSGQNSWLRAIGISREGLNETVTDQGLDGIFSYIGKEESALRANPLGSVGGVLEGLLGN